MSGGVSTGSVAHGVAFSPSPVRSEDCTSTGSLASRRARCVTWSEREWRTLFYVNYSNEPDRRLETC
jgi:hypothetical protein